MNSGLPASAAPLGGVGIACVKVKFCRYYAKDKTCFYGDECQFLHEEPSMASMSLHSGASPVPLSMSGGAVTYPLSAPPACPVGVPNVPKKGDSLGPAGTVLEGQMLTIPGMEGGTLSDANLTNSYFSSSFIGVNGFGSPAESKYSIMQRITNSSSSPSLLDDGAKNFSHSAHDLFHGTLAAGPGQSCGSMENSPWTTQSSFPLPLCPLPDPGNSPISSLFSDFGALSISQRRKVSITT
uniref:C3H1-type domain-containing protein n=1 Tax=Oncorhynchus tshawytscha TaxID=74940 RepID=A0A8C8ETR2_ONCTS